MGKALKTADELREMIMERAVGNPICPPGMTVRVRPQRMSWAIDCIPPTHIRQDAYIDCYEFLTSIAVELREQYDLASN